MSRDVHVIDHPLVQHKLTLMRRKDTSTKSFRELVHELSALLAYEITRDMPMQEIEIETPLEKMTSRVIDGKKVVLASILRAGNGFLDGMLQVIPGARVGHIGLYRDPATLKAVEYCFKMPHDMHERDVIVLDPHARHRQLRRERGGPAQEDEPALDPLRLSGDLPRRPQDLPRRPPRRAGLHPRRGPRAERTRLHRPGSGRRGRPNLWDEVNQSGRARSNPAP